MSKKDIHNEEDKDTPLYSYQTRVECDFCGEKYLTKHEKCPRCKQDNPDYKEKSSFTIIDHGLFKED